MDGIHFSVDQGVIRPPSPEERLLTRYTWCCQQFRENGSENAFEPGVNPVAWLLKEVMDMAVQFPETRFVLGLQALAVRTFPVLSQACFHCLCELFLDRPLVPVDPLSFMTDAAHYAFRKGIDFLVGNGLVIAVAVNKADESKATKDNFLLAPHVCGMLFRGREDLIRPTVIAQFGTLTLSKSIPVKDLIFPDSLRDRLALVSRAVSAERFDRVVGELAKHGMRGGVTVLLYGPPGTGKTEFVKYLGAALKTKVVVKMGSDLLDMYVGGTEARIRDAFQEAAAEKAILFLDEIDGLVQGRERASRSWEVTQVNELLHQMENFDGVMVGATNFFVNLDQAILRRFTFKLEFGYLDSEGKRIFFERMFASRLTSAEAARLDAIPDLAPGDFRTVRQAMFYLDGVADNAIRLGELEKEAAVKRQGRVSAPVGFSAA